MIASCGHDTQIISTKKVVSRIEPSTSPFEMYTIICEDGWKEPRASGWIELMHLKAGDTITVFMQEKDYPDTVFLYPTATKEDIFVQDEFVGFKVLYVSQDGRFMRDLSFKDQVNFAKTPSIKLCKSGYGYNRCDQPKVEIGFPASKPIPSDRVPK